MPATLLSVTCSPRAWSHRPSLCCTRWDSGQPTRPSTWWLRCWPWTRTSGWAWRKRWTTRTWTRDGCATTAVCAPAATPRPPACDSTRGTLSPWPRSPSTTPGSPNWPALTRSSRSCTSLSAISWTRTGCRSVSTRPQQHLRALPARLWPTPRSCRPRPTTGNRRTRLLPGGSTYHTNPSRG